MAPHAPPSVMLGLDPSIHTAPISSHRMGPRVKPEDDGGWVGFPVKLASGGLRYAALESLTTSARPFITKIDMPSLDIMGFAGTNLL
ncbi:hypothetical protein GA0061105_10324 [Rhizobium aethiopicum]|uniref:Uncharacterized protein n=1 Tax=Rhizobium aethiopicum TaxID=1138170 RepID=A0A1C3XZ90_9HYPH|nr:hypothetical protein GA0061105_10324 [Rhizobium aethiopicum]